MTKTPVVDAHHHFWDPTRRDYYWMGGDELASIRKPIGPEDLRPLLVQNEVDRTVIVQTVPSVEETQEFLSIAANTDFVAGVVGWVNLTDPAVGDILAELKDGERGKWLVGIRHQVHDEVDPDWVARKDVIRGIKAVGAAGLAYDLLPKQRELPACLPAVDANPEMRFVVDHIAKPLIASGEMEPWAARLKELAKRPNVYCKLSGMVTEADWKNWKPEHLKPYVERVLEWFGEDRVMFGSDWPVCLLVADYGTPSRQPWKVCLATPGGIPTLRFLATTPRPFIVFRHLTVSLCQGAGRGARRRHRFSLQQRTLVKAIMKEQGC